MQIFWLAEDALGADDTYLFDIYTHFLKIFTYFFRLNRFLSVDSDLVLTKLNS